MEEGTEGPSSMPNFTPHRCNDKGVGPPKLKFLLRFDRNVEYKRPAGAYPLRDFHKICRVCTSFQDALTVQIWMDLLKGLWSYGAFKLWRRVPANFQRSLAAKLCIRPQTFSRCKNVLEVLYHRAKFGGARISPATGAAKNVDFLSVCLSVRHTCGRQSL